MKKRTVVYICILALLVLPACEKDIPAPVFHISASPDPLMYGGCGDTLTFKVTGPGDNIQVDSIIASYNLYNSSGEKVKTGSISLMPAPGEPAVTYIGSVTFSIAAFFSSGGTPDSPVMYFGEGRVEFGAFVDARYITAPESGPWKPVGHTETKSIPVIPCLPTPTVPPPPTATTIPTHSGGVTPVSTGLPESASETPASPPPCSVEPNNPNCVP